MQIWVRPETSIRLTDAFSKLKNLKLKNVNRECGLAWTMFLLQSAPHLEELYIKVCIYVPRFIYYQEFFSFPFFEHTLVQLLDQIIYHYANLFLTYYYIYIYNTYTAFFFFFLFCKLQLMEHNCGDLASRKYVAWEVDSSFKHYNLARVTIARFYSTQEIIVTFIRRLIQAAINLEEICFRENAVLLCTYCYRTDPDAGSRFPQTDQEKETFTKRITTDDDGRSTTAVKIHIRS